MKRGSLITPLGWTALAVSLAAWLLGAVLGWIELFLGAATGLLTLALCSVFTASRARLTITLDPAPRRFVVGESADVEVRVRNDAKRRLLPMDLEVMVGDSMEPFRMPSLAGGGDWAKSFPVHGLRRGVVAIGPATTVRGDPLGLWERRVRWTETSHLFVHPYTIPLAPLGTGLLRDLEGRVTSDLSMSDLAFHTLREYSPGDDRRFIAWRASAKRRSAGGSLLVRQFQDTRRTQLLIIVDGDRDAYRDPDDFELAISVGASVGVQAIKDELDVTLLIADQEVRRRTGRRPNRQLILDACARADHTSVGLARQVTDGVKAAKDATYALIVTGAQPAFGDLRRVAAKIPRPVRTTAVRVEPGAKPTVSKGSSLTVLTLSQLNDLRALLSKGDAA